MKFYLMRHGEAEAFAESDQKRQLTDKGARFVRERTLSIKSSLSEIDCIIHSPYVRTAQTAAIVSEVLGIPITSSSNLWTPDADPFRALKSIEGLVNACPLYVTHMPIVSLVEALCTGDTRYPTPFECASITTLCTQVSYKLDNGQPKASYLRSHCKTHFLCIFVCMHFCSMLRRGDIL